MRLEVLRKIQKYSAVVEAPLRRAGITNKPKVAQNNETQREPKRKELEDVPDRGRNRGEGSTVLD